MNERLFLAVSLDDEVRHGLAAFLASRLAGEQLPGRVVAPENWHITVRFLGWSAEEQRDRVLGYLHDSLDVAPFVIGFAALGAFPRPGRATVLWLGIDRGSEPLARVAELAEEAAQAAGFVAEERPFHPHVTLSRIRPAQDVTALVARIDPFPLTQHVRGVTLYRSHLGRGGARYEAVERIPLQ